MSVTIPGLEWDPCGRLQRLREIRDQIVTGGATREVEFEAGPNGVRRRVHFEKSDLDRLDRLISEAEAACGTARGAGKSRPRTFYPNTSKGLS